MKLYIAVLDEVPDFIVPTLVAHTMLGAHLDFYKSWNGPLQDIERAALTKYFEWLTFSFKKCVVKVGVREFEKIAALPGVYLGHENKTLNGIKSCAIPLPVPNEELPKVLKFAKLWKPSNYRAGCAECSQEKERAENNTQWQKDIQKGREIISKM